MLAGTSWQGVCWALCSLPGWERNPTMGRAGAEGSQHIPLGCPGAPASLGSLPGPKSFAILVSKDVLSLPGRKLVTSHTNEYGDN